MAADDSKPLAVLGENIRSRKATVCVIGLGYVGLPLACAAAEAGYRVCGIDISPTRVDHINAGGRPLDLGALSNLERHVQSGRLSATTDFDALVNADIIVICVPTPITAQREPDLSHIRAAASEAARRLRPGQLVVLESTTWPGTTQEVLRPQLEETGLRSGTDFLLAFSPEREDPGNPHYGSSNTPKVIGADDDKALELGSAFYANVVGEIVPVSSSRTAEAVKLTENIFRSVNIALVNELKVVYHAMGIDVWEVIEAAKTKPFGYMPFYPGPGLGGHCIPIDPFYLTWKAREYDLSTHFIELAGEINSAMPRHVLARLAEELDQRQGRGLNGARILILGAAYKKNIADTRESPTLKMWGLLKDRKALVAYHDPHVAALSLNQESADTPMQSTELTMEIIAQADAVLILTDHDAVDYRLVHDNARLIVDTRNVLERRGLSSEHVAKA